MWVNTLQLVSTSIYFNVISLAVVPGICANPNHGFPKSCGLDRMCINRWLQVVYSRYNFTDVFVMGDFRFRETWFIEVPDSFPHFFPQNYFWFFCPWKHLPSLIMGWKKHHLLRLSKEASPHTHLWKYGQGLKSNHQILKPVKLFASILEQKVLKVNTGFFKFDGRVIPYI